MTLSKKTKTVINALENNEDYSSLKVEIFYESAFKSIKRPKTYSYPISFIRYADDFLVLCQSEEDALLAKSRLVEILRTRGLKFSPEKTNIRHITEGFDFLGCHIQSFEMNINITGNKEKMKKIIN